MAQPLIAGALVFGFGKGYGMMNQIEAPNDMYFTYAGLMGAAKIVADTNTEGSLNRSLSSGLLFAGLCYLIYKDENWALNGALGVSASYVADIAVPAREKEKEEDY
jgi:uncharacterized membrane protein (UPF0136 family)